MDTDEVVAQAQHPEIRLMQVRKNTSFAPLDDISVNGGGWLECTPRSVIGFSAIAYLYAVELTRELHVPVGVIDATWGGTPAEAWTSFDGLSGISGFERQTDILSRNGFDRQRMIEDNDVVINQWIAEAVQNGALQKGRMQTGNPWENRCLPGNFDGIVDITKEIDIPAGAAGKPLTLHLGAFDDEDIIWFNGTEAGRGYGYKTLRNYTIPAELVRKGKNKIKVRITDFSGTGGFNGQDEMRADCYVGSIPLDDDWDFEVMLDFSKMQERPVSLHGSGFPTVLYNAMINPLAPMPVRGVIWYQGCANVGRDQQYEILFKSLISDWRKLWKNDSMPFYFVQLAGYLTPRSLQPDSQWAALRNAQSKAIELPCTGMAVAIDLGNPGDIHPRNKRDMARRLAYISLAHTYGKDIVCEAPKLKSAVTKGDKMVLTFDGELHPRTVAITGFIVGDDSGTFEVANGRQTAPDTIELYSPRFKKPTIVRYNWADYPGGTLYGPTGLPVAPFATDK